jgi:hypothetical protein
MDTLNSNPTETETASTSVAAPVTSAPEATAAPAETAAPAPTPAPVAAPAAAPVPAVKMELPKTTGQTVGGWNRFAGYNPNAAKSKQKDGRGGPGRK